MTLTVAFDLHLENFNSAHNFSIIRHRAFILGRRVLYDDDTITVERVTLTVTFDLHMKFSYYAHKFLTIRHRAFI